MAIANFFEWLPVTAQTHTRREYLNSNRKAEPFQRSELALRLKPIVQARAKENRDSMLKQNSTVFQKSAKRDAIHTDNEIAKAANVSRDTIRKGVMLRIHTFMFALIAGRTSTQANTVIAKENLTEPDKQR